jgi:uncharacterized protein DUF5522
MKPEEFIEGRDYYFNEEGYLVLTERYLKERGYCCGMGCLHCPYKNTQIHTGENPSEPSEGDLKNSV